MGIGLCVVRPIRGRAEATLEAQAWDLALCLEVMPGMAIDSAVQGYLYLRSSVDVPCPLEHKVWSLMHGAFFYFLFFLPQPAMVGLRTAAGFQPTQAPQPHSVQPRQVVSEQPTPVCWSLCSMKPLVCLSCCDPHLPWHRLCSRYWVIEPLKFPCFIAVQYVQSTHYCTDHVDSSTCVAVAYVPCAAQ